MCKLSSGQNKFKACQRCRSTLTTMNPHVVQEQELNEEDSASTRSSSSATTKIPSPQIKQHQQLPPDTSSGSRGIKRIMNQSVRIGWNSLRSREIKQNISNTIWMEVSQISRRYLSNCIRYMVMLISLCPKRSYIQRVTMIMMQPQGSQKVWSTGSILSPRAYLESILLASLEIKTRKLSSKWRFNTRPKVNGCWRKEVLIWDILYFMRIKGMRMKFRAIREREGTDLK